jgi:GT2 family glycosyltransferase
VTGNGRVQIAYLHRHAVSHSWHESMMRLIGWDAANNNRITDTAGPFMISSDASGLVEARNAGVQRFLDETDHEWLWFVDTDMGFLPDTVDQLVAAADPAERPVVGALCFSLREICYDGYGGRRVLPVPTLYSPARTPAGHVGFSARFHYPPNTLLQVAGTGAACLLIHRGALEKLRAEWADAWFDRLRYEDGKLISEDLSFCARLARAGIPLFVHTGVKTTHHKQFWLSEEDYTPPVGSDGVVGGTAGP